MRLRMRTVSLPVAGLVAGLVLVPTAAVAAVGGFSSSTTTPALNAYNTGGGRSINGAAAGSQGLISVANGTQPGSAIYGLQRSSGASSNGVFGLASSPAGYHVGVWGATGSADSPGVLGESRTGDGIGVAGNGLVGVLGLGAVEGVRGDTSGTPGDGTFGVASSQDAALEGHVLGLATPGGGVQAGNFAGSCKVLATDTSATCNFPDAFGTGITPIVTATPTSDPVVSRFWVTATATGVTIHLTSAPVSAAVTFNYVVVGVGDTTAARPSARVQQAVTTTRSHTGR